MEENNGPIGENIVFENILNLLKFKTSGIFVEQWRVSFSGVYFPGCGKK